MKTAFLVLAHNQPSHLARLVKALKCDWAYIFIHVDRKSDISQFKELVPEDKSVIFLEGNQRVRVRWGGFSQVQAILRLMECALIFDESFGRFCLLSGSDFPVRSNASIRNQFCTRKEFLRVELKLDLVGDKHSARLHDNYARVFWFDDYPALVRNRLSGKIPRRPYRKIALYHGSQWWSLTIECVKYVMDFLKKNKSYIRFHRYTHCADEIFFHSIVKSSPFAANITHDFEMAPGLHGYFPSNVHGSHYIDWNAKNVSLPKVLDLTDLDSIVNSGALFARKFDEKISSSLVETLEERISLTGLSHRP